MLRTRLKVLAAAAMCPELWRLRPRALCGLMRASLTTRPASAPSGTIVYANCPPVGTEGFRRYLRGLRRMGRGEAVPLAAHIAVTDRCPNRCERCSNLSRTPTDPPAEQILKVLAELKDLGTASVAFTGGEPLIRPDLERLIAASNPHMPPMLFTSGAGLDRPRARSLRRAGLAAAFVSLDHHSADEHDRIRGTPGAFDAVVRAIGKCISAGIYTAAQAVVSPALLQDGAMDRFLQFCLSLGVHDVVLLEPVAVGGCPTAGELTDAQRRMLYDLHLRAARDRSLPKITAMSYMESADFFGCQAGFGLVYISAGGDVFPCDFAPISFGNVREASLRSIMSRMWRELTRPVCSCLGRCMPQRNRSQLPVCAADPEAGAAIARQQEETTPALMRYFLPAKEKG